MAAGESAEEVLPVFIGGGDCQQGGAIGSKQLDASHLPGLRRESRRAIAVAVQEDRVADQAFAGVMPGRGIAKVLGQVASRGQVLHCAEVGRAGAVRVVGREPAHRARCWCR